MRVDDRSDLRAGVELVQKRPANGCFAGTDLAGYENETFPFTYSVYQAVQRFRMLSTGEEKFRIRRSVERLFAKPVKSFVHTILLLANARRMAMIISARETKDPMKKPTVLFHR
jgi:hypothetical protein